MKNKLITFLISMGIPIFSINSINSCTGFCNNCQLNCIPGIVLIIIISYKYVMKKVKQKWQESSEKY